VKRERGRLKREALNEVQNFAAYEWVWKTGLSVYILFFFLA